MGWNTIGWNTEDWNQGYPQTSVPGGGGGEVVTPSPLYSSTTLGMLKTKVMGLVADADGDYYTESEVGYGIAEALRTWGVMTGYWCGDVGFTLSHNNTSPYYDLSTSTPTARPRTVKWSSVVKEIQGHLCEPIVGLSGNYIQFSPASIIRALVVARNRFTTDTHLPLAHYRVAPTPPPPSPYTNIPQTIATVYNVYHNDLAGGITQLHKEGYGSLRRLESSGPREGVPVMYARNQTGPMRLYLHPSPAAQYELSVLAAVNDMSWDGVEDTALGLFDDHVPAVKYAAMETLLTADGENQDLVRAGWCKARYLHYLGAIKVGMAVNEVGLNGVPVPVVSIDEMGKANWKWRATYGVRPSMVGVAGDMVAFNSVPTATYSCTMNVVLAAPVPSGDGGYVQVGEEDMDAIIGYAVGYLMLKHGGAEVVQYKDYLDRFFSLAQHRNYKLVAANKGFREMVGGSGRENRVVSKEVETGVGVGNETN